MCDDEKRLITSKLPHAASWFHIDLDHKVLEIQGVEEGFSCNISVGIGTTKFTLSTLKIKLVCDRSLQIRTPVVTNLTVKLSNNDEAAKFLIGSFQR